MRKKVILLILFSIFSYSQKAQPANLLSYSKIARVGSGCLNNLKLVEKCFYKGFDFIGKNHFYQELENLQLKMEIVFIFQLEYYFRLN